MIRKQTPTPLVSPRARWRLVGGAKYHWDELALIQNSIHKFSKIYYSPLPFFCGDVLEGVSIYWKRAATSAGFCTSPQLSRRPTSARLTNIVPPRVTPAQTESTARAPWLPAVASPA